MPDFGVNSFAERLRGITPNRGDLSNLSRTTGIPIRTLSHWANGRGEPPVAELAKIAEASGVPLDWLVLGRGSMDERKMIQAHTISSLNTDHRLIGRLTEKIAALYKEMGFSIALHQVAERAALEHDRIVAAVADPDDRLIQIGEVVAELRHELRAKAVDPTTSKRQA